MEQIVLRTTELGQASDSGANELSFESLAPRGRWTSSGSVSVPGVILQGTYQYVCRRLPEVAEKAQALVALFTHGSGMEGFLEAVSELLPGVPLTGGAAARLDPAGRGAVFPESTDVALAVITEGGWRADTVSFHRPTGIHFWIEGQGKRDFSRVNVKGQVLDAESFLYSIAEAQGVDNDILDRVAIRDLTGRVLHVSKGSEGLHVSSNLPVSRYVEWVIFDEDYGRENLTALMTSPGFAFGCAGLHGLISDNRPWETQWNTCYMYGEAVMLKGKPAFANLSFSVLQVISDAEPAIQL